MPGLLAFASGLLKEDTLSSSYAPREDTWRSQPSATWGERGRQGPNQPNLGLELAASRTVGNTPLLFKPQPMVLFLGSWS